MVEKTFRVKKGLDVEGPNYDASIIDGVLTLGTVGNINGANSSTLAINTVGTVAINLDTNDDDTAANAIFKVTEGGSSTGIFTVLSDGKVEVTNDMTFTEGDKIIFDSADTYIKADTATAENLQIAADGSIQFMPDDDIVIKAGTTEWARFDGSQKALTIGSNLTSRIDSTVADEARVHIITENSGGGDTNIAYDMIIERQMGDADSPKQGPILALFSSNDPASGAGGSYTLDDTTIGGILFRAHTDSDTDANYGLIRTTIQDSEDSSRDSKMFFRVMRDSSFTDVFVIDGQNDTVDVKTANLSVAENIVHTGDTDNKITFGTDTQSFDTGGSTQLTITNTASTFSNTLTTTDLSVADEILHSGDTDNKIAFGTDTQSFETGGTARMNINNSGLQVGSGTRVTTILDQNDMSSDSNTALATQQSIKAYVDSEVSSASGGGATTLNGLTDVVIHAGNSIIMNNFGGAPATGTLSSAVHNVGIGDDALASLTEGDYNTAIGRLALDDITTGAYNTAIGSFAGGGVAADLTYLTAVGYQAGRYASSSSLTAVGRAAGTGGSSTASNNSGEWNTAIGSYALTAYTEGHNNTALGAYSLTSLTLGDRNVGVGKQAGYSITEGIGNVAIGNAALYTTTTADYNIAIGNDALKLSHATAAEHNIGIGQDAGYHLYTDHNIGLGYQALRGSSTVTNNTGAENIGIGYKALTSFTTGGYNIAIGHEAGTSVTTGDKNVSIGFDALNKSTAANYNVAIGSNAAQYMSTSQNVAVGYEALQGSTVSTNNTGTNNTALGFSSLRSYTTGTSNTAVGSSSSVALTTGSSNTAVGHRSFQANTEGSFNVSVGASSMHEAATDAGDNTAVGYQAGYYFGASRSVAIGKQAARGSGTVGNNTGSDNIGIGYRTLYAHTSGYQNVGIGHEAGYSVTTGDNNIGIGHEALHDVTTGDGNVGIGTAPVDLLVSGSNNVGIGYAPMGASATDVNHGIAIGYQAGRYFGEDYNIALGYHALHGSTTATDNTGMRNIAIGYEAAKNYTTGQDNVAIGYQALESITTGSTNVAIGDRTLDALTIGANNIAIGQLAGSTTSNNMTGGVFLGRQTGLYMDGDHNIAIGDRAVEGSSTTGNNTGDYNVGIGYQPMYDITSGNKNVAIGYYAGLQMTTGRGNVVIGEDAGTAITTGDFNITIGKDAGDSLQGGDDNIFIGRDAGQNATSGSDNVVIGCGPADLRNATGSKQFLLKSGSETWLEGFDTFGTGNYNMHFGQNHNYYIPAHTSSNSVTGGNLWLGAGAGTGTASGGDLILQYAPAGGSDNTTHNSYSNALTVSGSTGDVTIHNNLIVSGSTTTLNTATMTVEDHNVVLGSGNSTSAVVDGTGLTLEGGSGDDITFQYSASNTRMELKHGSAFEDFKAGTVTGTFVGGLTGNVTGNVSGTAATVTGAAQTNITSLGTLTGLTGGTGDLVWDTDTLFVDSSADRVGIGTSSPDESLHVVGDALVASTGSPTLSVKTTAANSQQANIVIHGARNAENTIGQITFTNADDSGTNTGTYSAANILAYNDGGDKAGGLKFQTTPAGSSTTLATAMTIREDGDVGIGTTSPSKHLHVDAGTTNLGGIQITSGGANAGLTIENDGTNGGTYGIYVSSGSHSAGTNKLLFLDGTTARMTLDSSGKVGIGTTNPDDLLEIEGTNAIMRVDASASGSGVAQVKFDDQGTPKWSLGLSKNVSLSGADFHIFEDASSNSPRFTVKDGGNVGIGTTSPGHKLHVTGPPDDSGDYAIYADEGNDNYVGLVNRHSGNRRTALFYRNIHADYTAQPMVEMHNDHASDDQTVLEITQDGSGHALTTTGGNVGIGTTSPQANLHISGGTGDGVLIIEADTDNSGESDQPYIIFEQDGGTQHSAIGSHSGGDTDNNALIFSNSVGSSGVEAGMIFKTGETSGYANATERMRITPAGKVGLGTSIPAVNLHVSHDTDPKIRIQDTTHNYSTTLSAYSGGAYLALGDMDSGESSWMLLGAYSNINNLNTRTRDFHLYGTNTTTGFYFDESAGTFGIGTNAPGGKLDVSGVGVYNNPTIKVNNSSDATYVHGAQFIAPNIDSGDVHLIAVGQDPSTNDAAWFGFKKKNAADGSADNILTMGLWGANNLLNIKPSGHVGIGTEEPSTRLHVAQSGTNELTALTLDNGLDTNGGRSVGMDFRVRYASTNIASSYIGFDYYGTKLTSNSHGMIYRSGRADFAHHHFVADDNTRQMMISDSGKVGIGSIFNHASQPTDTLSIDGGIKIGEFNSTDGTGYAGGAAPSASNNGTGSSDPQIRVAGRTSDAPGIIQMAQFDANNFLGGTNPFVLGRLQYAMNENSNEVTTVAEIRGISSDPNDPGHFDGALTFWTSQGDASGANLTQKMELNADGNLILDGGSLIIKERASAPADAAGYGQLWVKSDGDGELYFTDDNGTDIQLTDDGAAAGGGGGGGGVSLSGSTDNTIATVTGSNAIQGEANLTFDGSTLALAGKQTITVADTVSEAFKVTITDSDSTADSTPFIVDGDGRVGIGTASPVAGTALTLNGDGTSYEGIAYLVNGSTKFKMSTDSSSFYHDSSISGGKVTFRTRNSSGTLRPSLVTHGANHSVSIGYNGTSGSTHTSNNTLQVNVGTEDGVADKDDGILLLNSDTSIADGDMIGGIGFATRDGNIPSVTTEAAAAIVAYAAEDHSTGDKGGDLAFLTSAIDDNQDTASNERMRITSEGQVGIGLTNPIALMHVKADNSATSQTTAGSANITIEQDGTGDAALNFLLTGVRRWIMGIDNSDSDKFKIQTGATSLDGTNHVDALTIESNGDVGIGTTSPARPLHVVGDAYVQSGDILLSRGNYYLQDASDGTKRGSFTSDGVWAWENVSVGIGTTSPEEALQVEGNIRIHGGSGGKGAQLDFGDDYRILKYTTADTLLMSGPEDVVITIDNNNNATTNFFAVGNNDREEGDTHYNELFRVQEDGNVGIGTTSPGHLLDVDGNARVGTTGVAGALYLSADAAGSYLGWNSNGTDITLAADDDLILHADDTMAFQSGGTTTMTLLSGGNLGIGITSPGEKLHVAGAGDQVIKVDSTSDGRASLVLEGYKTSDAVFSQVAAINNADSVAGMLFLRDGANDASAITLNTQATGSTSVAERLRIASGGAITFNEAYTFPTSDGSANQVLATDGSGALTFEDNTGFVIFGEESDDYISSTSTAGNTNGFQFSYGNGAQNTTKSSSGSDFGMIIPVACKLVRLDFHFGNKGSETNSSTQTFTVYKNNAESTTTVDFSASGSGGNAFKKSFSSLSGDGLTYAAGDAFNLRTTGVSGWSDTQIGPARMTAYFKAT